MKAIKIKENLVGRLDALRGELSIDTRQNLANTVLQKGLDFLEKNGYDALIKIPAIRKDENERLDTTG